MHIIFSNYDDIQNPYYAGGGAVAVHEVARRLARNHQVTVYTGTYPGSKNESIDGIRYVRVGWYKMGARFGQLSFHFSLPWRVLVEKFDVWIESFTPPFSTALLPIFTRKPVIGLTHMLGGRAMRHKYKLPFDFFERLGLHAYKHIIVLQQALKDELAHVAPRVHTYIIPNGVDEQVFGQRPLPKQGYIAFLGRIDFEQKGLDLLLQAYARAQGNTTLSLRIAGTGLEGDLQELRKRIAALDLSGRVELVGKLSGQAKFDFLNRAEFLVMSSKIENFSLVLLEAFALALPAVVFAIPGMQWVPETAALKVVSFDIDAYAQAIVRLSQNPVLLAQMGAEARACAKQYSWDKISLEYDQVLTDIARRSQ